MAARGLNKVMLIGNLGAEPEVRFTATGSAVANIRLATAESWRDKEGNQQERTEWHRVVFFGKVAEIVQQYLHKGSKVYIEGSIRTNKWQDQSGNDRYTTEIVANDMQMLDSRGSSSSASFDQSPPAAPQKAPSSAPAQQAPAAPQIDEFDDDIPF